MKDVSIFWLVNVAHLFSYRNDEWYWRLEFIDDATGELLMTYISENNLNYRHWHSIIEEWQPTVALGLGSVRKSVKPGVLNADCKPAILHEADRDQLMQLVHRNWYS